MNTPRQGVLSIVAAGKQDRDESIPNKNGVVESGVLQERVKEVRSA